jgi:nitrite reductase (NADH) large subunit
MAQKIVIVGGSIAGISAAEAARLQDPEAQIIFLSAENDLPYYRLRLCEVLDNPAVASDLTIEPREWYEAHRFELRLNEKVIAIDRQAKLVQLASGTAETYDRLVIACGSTSLVPPIEGVKRQGVKTLWTMAEAREIAALLTPQSRVVVIGGGLLGLLAAHHIRRSGAQTTILERADRLIANQLDEAGSAIFKGHVDQLGIQVVFAADTQAIIGADESSDSPAAGVRLSDGQVFAADLVLVSVGVRANIAFAEAAGLAVDRRIVTNTAMQTSDPDIFAAGDAAEPDQYWFGLWPVAMDQGWVAGINAAGGATVYSKTIPPYFVQAMDTQVAVLGDRGGPGEVEPTIELDHDIQGGKYRKLIYRNDVLTGFMLVGDTSEFVELKRKLGQPRGLI